MSRSACTAELGCMNDPVTHNRISGAFLDPSGPNDFRAPLQSQHQIDANTSTRKASGLPTQEPR